MAGRMKGADQDVSGTTFTDADDISWDLEYGKPEYFEIEVYFACTGVGSGAKFRLNSTESIAAGNFWASVDGGVVGILTGLSDTIGGALAPGDHHVRISGGYFPADPAGTFSLQFAQFANLGGAVTVKRCSWYNHLPELP